MQRPLQWFCEDQPSDQSKLSAYQIYTWAKQIQSASKLEFLRKIWTDGLYCYDFKLTPHGDMVHVWALSEGNDLILLSNGSEIWAYDYIKNVLVFRKKLPESTSTGIDQAYPFYAHVQNYRLRAKDNTVAVVETDATTYDANVMLPYHAASVLRKDNALTIKYGTAADGYATLPSAPVWGNLLSEQRTVGLLASRAGMWNLNNGTELWQAEPNDISTLSNTWHWTPRIWVPELGNSYMLPYGIYYGYALDHLSNPQPSADDVTVQLACLLEDRGGGSVGYCEILTHYDESDTKKAYFIDSMWEADRDSDYYYSLSASYGTKTAQNNYWASAPAAGFDIDYASLLPVGDASIYWWSARGGAAKSFVQGVVAWNATGIMNGWVLHSRTGGSLGTSQVVKVAEGAHYRAHSVSADGKTVSVFFGDTAGESIITGVYVYDIEQGIVLRQNGNVDGHEFGDGIIIPRDLELQQRIPYTPQEAKAIPDTSSPLLRPCLGGWTMPHPRTDGFSANGWKVAVDGRNARGFLWQDECWENAKYTRQTWSSPGGGPAIDSLENFVYYVDGEGHRESGQATFAEQGWPQAIGEEVYERSTAIDFFEELPDNTLGATKNAKPPYTFSGDVTEGPFGGWVLAYDGCGGDLNVTMTDACGLRRTKSFPNTESPDPVIGRYADTAAVGDPACYVIDAGSGQPLTYSNTGPFVVNSTTGIIESITGCGTPGENRTGTVSVTDSCGRVSNTITVYLAGGHWVPKDPLVWSCSGPGEILQHPYGDNGGYFTCIDSDGIMHWIGYFQNSYGSSYCSSEIYACARSQQVSVNPCTGENMANPPQCYCSGGNCTITNVEYATQQMEWVC